MWFWLGRSLQNHAPFAWKNPGDGFSTGCTEWTTSCGASYPDLLFSLAGPPGCLSLSNLELTNQTINEPKVFEACDAITAGPNLRIVSGGDVEFWAPSIVLRNGFSVEAGAAFAAGE